MYEFRWTTRTLLYAGLVERVEEFVQPSDRDSCKVIVAPGESWVETVLAVLQGRLESGGSAIDASKVIAERGGVNCLCTELTTSGSGGEISPWGIIGNLGRREKESVVAMWPDLILLDPSGTTTFRTI